MKLFLNRNLVSQNMVSQSKSGFPKYGFSIEIWFPKIWFLNRNLVSQNMVSQSKSGFPKYGFSIKKWFPKIWFLNHKMVSQNMVSQSNFGKLYVSKSATDSNKCISATDSSCFRTIIECITSYDSSVWFKLIVYKVKYSICCFKTLRYFLLTIFDCFSIYAFFFSIFIIGFSNGI